MIQANRELPEEMSMTEDFHFSCPDGKRVFLISMPWANPLEPSFELGIMKQHLLESQLEVTILEAPMQLLRWLKLQTYGMIASQFCLGDFAFTGEFDPELSPEQLEALKRICDRCSKSAPNLFETVLKIRKDVVPKFLDDFLKSIDLTECQMVLFWCGTGQIFSSLALGRKLRELKPDILLAYSGKEIIEPVGTHIMRAFPNLIDVICFSDPEPTIVPLAEAASGLRNINTVPGIFWNDQAGTITQNYEKSFNLDESYTPCYRDFEDQRKVLINEYKIRIENGGVFPIEGSRGCSWGEKSQCVFCGTSKRDIKFRQKSGELVLRDIDVLNNAYGARQFHFLDSMLSSECLRVVFPELKKRGAPFRLKIRSRAVLSDTVMELLRDSGVSKVHLGIESFQTSVLKKAKKGVSGIRNIQTIYNFMKYNISPLYSFLYGFPEDTVEEYKALVSLVPALFHLYPPFKFIEVVILRHSLLERQAGSFGCRGALSPDYHYDMLFSKKVLEDLGIDLKDICNNFQSYAMECVDPELLHLYEIISAQVNKWKEMYFSRSVYLSYTTDPDGITFIDTRSTALKQLHKLSPEHRDVYLLLAGKIKTLQGLSGLLGSVLCEDQIKKILEDMCLRRFVVREKNRFIGIAFHESFYEERVLGN